MRRAGAAIGEEGLDPARAVEPDLQAVGPGLLLLERRARGRQRPPDHPHLPLQQVERLAQHQGQLGTLDLQAERAVGREDQRAAGVLDAHGRRRGAVEPERPRRQRVPNPGAQILQEEALARRLGLRLGRPLDAELLAGTQADHIPVGHRHRLVDALLVHEGPVGAAQIAQPERPLLHPQERVAPRDRAVYLAQRALR